MVFSTRIGSFLAMLALGSLVACGGGGGGGGGDSTSTPTATPASSSVCEARRALNGYDVVLLIGQSNMSGFGAYYVAGFDTTDPRIQQWTRASTVALAQDPLQHVDAPVNAGRIGPAMSFARKYLQSRPANRKVLLVPAALGGTSFAERHWNPGDAIYEDALARLNAAYGTDPVNNCVAAVLWSQGESDVGRTAPLAYRTALEGMIANLRSRATAGSGASTAPFLLGQFSPDWIAPTPTPDQQGILDIINGTPARVRYTAVVSTAGLTSNNTQGLNGAVHLDAASHRIYGVRYFDALAKALANSAAP
jgi:hypothetical protein